MSLLIGLQSILRPPNRNKELSDTTVSVCQDLPTGVGDAGTLANIFSATLLIKTTGALGKKNEIYQRKCSLTSVKVKRSHIHF